MRRIAGEGIAVAPEHTGTRGDALARPRPHVRSGHGLTLGRQMLHALEHDYEKVIAHGRWRVGGVVASVTRDAELLDDERLPHRARDGDVVGKIPH